ncbi:hypothetical protein BDV27DRAFT_120820 [Aspergillus caelatus]|uniref:Uncharacterized protein n=1 Tax=Aspergillus caelatus TaxID=61420 RepID=A0A5N7AHK0_9EURO|nr:uncharacterized protein BDV27DRAFT_120820 [Aspergillus caelatus]KAE8369367.1 hypothetical protein BDV27DRAFT_120820 [Aspergillus caelatus]
MRHCGPNRMIPLCVHVHRNSAISSIVYPANPHCLIWTNQQPHIFHETLAAVFCKHAKSRNTRETMGQVL